MEQTACQYKADVSMPDMVPANKTDHSEGRLKNKKPYKMIPKVIHYCWMGRGEMPQLAKDCIASWHELMPDWEYKLWNEDNFDVNINRYVKEAYETGKCICK